MNLQIIMEDEHGKNFLSTVVRGWNWQRDNGEEHELWGRGSLGFAYRPYHTLLRALGKSLNPTRFPHL